MPIIDYSPKDYAEIYKDRVKPGTLVPSSDYLTQWRNGEASPPPRLIRRGDISEYTHEDYLADRNSPPPEITLSPNVEDQAESSQPDQPPIVPAPRLINEQGVTTEARIRPEVPARANTKYNLRKRPRANKHKDYLYQSDE